MAFNAFVRHDHYLKQHRDIIMRRFAVLLAAAAMASLPLGAVRADDAMTITIKDHVFSPSEIKVPANKRVTITVVNDDATPEEFESHPMKIEKVIPGKSKGTVRIGPLKPGKYPFVGEYHESTAKGTVTAE
jgi:plastocyanin